jgi:hypothetical protein
VLSPPVLCNSLDAQVGLLNVVDAAALHLSVNKGRNSVLCIALLLAVPVFLNDYRCAFSTEQMQQRS